MEQFYVGLLVATTVLSGWFAYFVVHRLLTGDRAADHHVAGTGAADRSSDR